MGASILCLLLLASAAWNGAPRSYAGPAIPAPPPVFASADQVSNGRTAVRLRSVVTGAVVQQLATFGSNFTNNGFAISPDGTTVFFTLVPRNVRTVGLRLEQLRADGRGPTPIGPGGQPSVSPDGTRLAYGIEGAHAQRIVVRDLRTGRSRWVGVADLIGRGGDLLNASIAWLGDNRTVVVLPGSVAIAAAAGHRPYRRLTTAGFVIVHSVSGGRLVASKRVVRHLTDYPLSIYEDASRPASILSEALLGTPDIDVLDRIDFAMGKSHVVRAVAAIPRAQVMAIESFATHILYIQGHGPVELWEAGLGADGLVSPRRLLSDNPVGAAAW